MSFSNFNLQKEFITSIEEAGYTEPTPLQSELIPLVADKKSVLVWTQSASGKTGAFLIPAMNYILENPNPEKRGARVLILTSRRDRVSQINYTIKRLSTNHTMRFGFVVSGRPYQTQMRLMRRPLDIMIATPGRLNDLMNNGKADFSQLEMLIIDDLSSIYKKNLQGLIEKIIEQAGSNCNSLTFVKKDDNVTSYAEQLFSNSIQINFNGEETSEVIKTKQPTKPKELQANDNKNKTEKITKNQPQKIKTLDPNDFMAQKVHVADDYTHKIAMMDHLMDEFAGEKTVIYTSTNRAAKTLLENLSNHGHAAEMLNTLSSEEINTSNILIIADQDKATLTTELMAKKDLHIIHFDLPRRAEQYFTRLNNHQQDSKEETLLMVDGQNYNELKGIEKTLGAPLEQITVPGLEPLNPFVNQSKNRPHNKSKSNQKNARNNNRNKGQNNKNKPRNTKNKRSNKTNNDTNHTQNRQRKSGVFGRTKNGSNRKINSSGRNASIGVSKRGTQAPNSDRAWESDFAEPKERKIESKRVVIRYKDNKKSLLIEKPESD